MQCNKMLPWMKLKDPDFHAMCDNIKGMIGALMKSARLLARFSAR